MSDRKPTNVEVLKVEVKGPNLSKAQVQCLDTNEKSWHPFYRKVYRTDEPTQAEKMVVPGARLKIGLQYKEGKSDGKGGKYPSEWCIMDAEPLAGVQEARAVFDSPVEAPSSHVDASPPTNGHSDTPRPIQVAGRDSLIVAQVAYKAAAELGVAHYSAVGREEFEKEGGVNLIDRWAKDFYSGILELARTGGDPFASNE